MIAYSFGQIESIIPAPFRDYVIDCWYLHSMVSICVKRNRICIFLLTQILVKEISRTLQEKLWLLGKRLLFLWFHDGNRNTFVKKGKKIWSFTFLIMFFIFNNVIIFIIFFLIISYNIFSRFLQIILSKQHTWMFLSN